MAPLKNWFVFFYIFFFSQLFHYDYCFFLFVCVCVCVWACVCVYKSASERGTKPIREQDTHAELFVRKKKANNEKLSK